MLAFHRGVLQRSVHSFNLAVRPGMLDLGASVFRAMFPAHTIEDVLERQIIACAIGELNTVVWYHGGDPVRHVGNQIAQN